MIYNRRGSTAMRDLRRAQMPIARDREHKPFWRYVGLWLLLLAMIVVWGRVIEAAVPNPNPEAIRQ